MTTALDAPVLAPNSVLVLESVLALGSSPLPKVRSAVALDDDGFNTAISELVAEQLIRLTGPGGPQAPASSVAAAASGAAGRPVMVRPGGRKDIADFVRRGGLIPAPARRLVGSRQTLDSVLTGTTAGVRRITDVYEVQRTLSAELETCSTQIMNVHYGPPMSEAILNKYLPGDLAMLERGLIIKTVNPVEHLRAPHIRGATEVLTAHGAQIRFADATPYHLMIVGDRFALMPIERDDPYAGALVVTEPVLVSSLAFLANSLLAGARVAEEIPDPDADYLPTPLDRRVLSVMNSGATDRTAASRLGVGERQFRRYVANIMSRLGATSRFQAGVRAVERGWI